MKLLVATGNRHKRDEIRRILAIDELELVGLDDIPGAPEVIEDGATFEANAVKKAVQHARHAGLWTLADDSGIAVAVLDGAPGVWSARYAGAPCDDAANNRKLLAALADAHDRRAAFSCVIALAAPDGRVETVRGDCPGLVVETPRGSGGFGYDPLFMPEGVGVTFAELAPADKNRISHRARALAAARARWWPGGHFTFPD